MSHPDDRPSRPISEKQLAANRANARKSTGPRTAEGKARSAMNAIIHEDSVRVAVTAEEEPRHFILFSRLIRADLRPADFLQTMLVERIIDLLWKMRRVRRAQRDFVDADAWEKGEDLAESARRAKGDGHADMDLLHGSQILLQAMRRPGGDRGAYERLDRYADRLQRALVSALLRLRQEQNRSGVGRESSGVEFTKKSVRRATRRALGEWLDGVEIISEATAASAPRRRKTGATGPAADTSTADAPPAGDARREVKSENEPTAEPRNAHSAGTRDPSPN